MDNVIIFQKDDGKVAVIFPANCGLSLQEIAKKDVPADKPFKIISRDELPEWETLDIWEVDFSDADGAGMGYEAWIAEQDNN